jgi:hypothetical protein
MPTSARAYLVTPPHISRAANPVWTWIYGKFCTKKVRKSRNQKTRAMLKGWYISHKPSSGTKTSPFPSILDSSIL